MISRTFVAFDIESTGLDPIKERMIELSAVKFTEDGEVLGEFDELMNPGVPIPEAASKVNKIYEEDLRGKPGVGEILKKFLEFLGPDSILLAHNSEFDARFIGSELQLCGLPIPENKILDTLPMSRAFVKNIMNHKMETLVHHFGFKADGFHRALVDSYHVMHLFLRFLKDGMDYETIEENGASRTFGIARDIFRVQLPLNLMSLKKGIRTRGQLKFFYEEEPGESSEVKCSPIVLFKSEKYSFLYATREGGDYPEAFRLDRLSKPCILSSIGS